MHTRASVAAAARRVAVAQQARNAGGPRVLRGTRSRCNSASSPSGGRPSTPTRRRSVCEVPGHPARRRARVRCDGRESNNVSPTPLRARVRSAAARPDRVPLCHPARLFGADAHKRASRFHGWDHMARAMSQMVHALTSNNTVHTDARNVMPRSHA